jgi:putative tryptophan/tyrosine transport system substrate-binding protein
MRRREFIAGLGSAVAWPVGMRAAGAQQSEMPVIGYLAAGSANTSISLEPFLQGLKESGFVEGQNVIIEYRWADGQYDRLRAMAADLVNRRVAVIFASGGAFVAVVAKAATADDPDRVSRWRGSRQPGIGRQPQQARRQCHGRLQSYGTTEKGRAIPA